MEVLLLEHLSRSLAIVPLPLAALLPTHAAASTPLPPHLAVGDPTDLRRQLRGSPSSAQDVHQGPEQVPGRPTPSPAPQTAYAKRMKDSGLGRTLRTGSIPPVLLPRRGQG